MIAAGLALLLAAMPGLESRLPAAPLQIYGVAWKRALVGAQLLACVLGAIWFGRALPELRIEARRLIVAQGLAGGEPAQEMNAQPVEE